MRRLPTIAIALGEERTRTELLPFLEEVAQEDEDEVLSALSEELGAFVEYVGGPAHGNAIIPPLEILSGMEEPAVRDRAVESLNKVCESMTPDLVDQHIVPLIKRLSSAEWFTSRVSATALYASAIAKLDAQRQSVLLSMYQDLSQDDAPMVRRAAATSLPKVIAALPDVQFEGKVHDMFMSQISDDQDSVRLLSVDVLIAIAGALRKAGNTSYNSELISLTLQLFTDKSWRVRYMAADRFENLAQALDSAELREKYVPAFVSLLKDSEAEVRTAASKQIPGFCALIPRQAILTNIIPTVEVLADDANQHVRAALASEISRLAPLLGKEKTTEFLLPTFLEMLKDDFPDVRLNIISKLQMVNDVIGIDLLSKSLLPAISELAKDKQWRVRLAIIEYIPLLAQQLGVEFFDRELAPLCMAWLWDSVYSIREAAAQNLRKLAEVFGVQWAKDEIIPNVIVVAANTNYLYRLTALFAVMTMIPVLDEQALTESILPFVLNLVEDPIPNIRFNVAKALKVLAEACLGIDNAKSSEPSRPPISEAKQVIEETIVPRLEKMTSDADVDVRYFARRSLDDISELAKKHMTG